MTKTCFTCQHLVNRHPITADALGQDGYEFRCNLKFNDMKPFILWEDEFYTLKLEAIEAARNCSFYKEESE